MNNQNKYNCFLIYNISNQDYDPLFQPSWLKTATARKRSDRSWYPFPDRVAPPGSEAYRSSMGHCSVSIGHWEHMMLILHDYCRTICPTFCPKTSDIGVKTSDMSGCPTVFQKH